jgi:hypothetical protein
VCPQANLFDPPVTRSMIYPLTLRFKILALAPQIYINDAHGTPVCYVKQKLFKLREKVDVFRDASRQQQLCTIAADRIIDWSARYTFSTPSGQPFGKMGRRGMRSLWSAHYDLFDTSGNPLFNIREENPWAKLGDTLLTSIPVLGLATGFLFHPRYLATRADGTPVFRLTKESAFFEGRFRLDKLADSSTQEELNLILAYMMMILLERQRG